jgi:light-regulated signal transduction histidine kinase (bacteriophytochrome)
VNIHQENDEVQVDVQDNGVGHCTARSGSRILTASSAANTRLFLPHPEQGWDCPSFANWSKCIMGRIWMTSTGVPGEGSTFSFTLPTVHNGV